MMFHQFGLADTFPPNARYAIMVSLTCLPFFFLCLVLYCFPDESPEETLAPRAKLPDRNDETVRQLAQKLKQEKGSPDRKKREKVE
jgi:hypothetical protein